MLTISLRKCRALYLHLCSLYAGLVLLRYNGTGKPQPDNVVFYLSRDGVVRRDAQRATPEEIRTPRGVIASKRKAREQTKLFYDQQQSSHQTNPEGISRNDEQTNNTVLHAHNPTKNVKALWICIQLYSSISKDNRPLNTEKSGTPATHL